MDHHEELTVQDLKHLLEHLEIHYMNHVINLGYESMRYNIELQNKLKRIIERGE